jgi:hypothetical protein
MMLSVTFYRPREYFSGFLNKFVTWMTSGEFCHCDLVVHTTPTDIMEAVKQIYTAAQENEYAPEDCQRILHQIESNFFSTGFRNAAQKSDTMTLAFSALWGNPMTVRVLTDVSHDSWYQIPGDTTAIAEIKRVESVPKQKSLETLKFAIEEMGKDYDTSGALCSWLPWSTSEPRRQYESYFCSEFCVTAFQRIGFMDTLVPLHTTPNALYEYMAIK